VFLVSVGLSQILSLSTTGVIAAGIDERITVFNNEAGQITELNSRDILDQHHR